MGTGYQPEKKFGYFLRNGRVKKKQFFGTPLVKRELPFFRWIIKKALFGRLPSTGL